MTNKTSEWSGIPQGIYVPSLKMFHVPETKGKTFSNGGFGISLPKEMQPKEMQPKNGSGNDNNNINYNNNNLFLWIEEALFLHDSGMATFVTEHQEALTTHELYLMLADGGIEFAVYRVYAHLRNQTYRVLRFTPQIIKRDDRKRYLTCAQLPTILTKELHVAWKVYLPNAKFKKTNPGPPDFLVAISLFSSQEPSFASIQSVLQCECQCSTIPLKLATVSDSGTVLMFAVTDCGVPNVIHPKAIH